MCVHAQLRHSSLRYYAIYVTGRLPLTSEGSQSADLDSSVSCNADTRFSLMSKDEQNEEAIFVKSYTTDYYSDHVASH